MVQTTTSGIANKALNIHMKALVLGSFFEYLSPMAPPINTEDIPQISSAAADNIE